MKIPHSTYRLQFNPEFNFKKAEKILPYLFELGISDVYASPIFRVNKGSTNGYDIVDLNKLNPELGSNTDFTRLIKKIKKYKLGWIQDIVPNHMSCSCENRMLMDVFEKGENSEFYPFFDIRWDYTHDMLNGKILVPFLGKPYKQALQDGEIKLKYEDGRLSICYFKFMLPVRLSCYKEILCEDLKDSKLLNYLDKLSKFEKSRQGAKIDNIIKTIWNLKHLFHKNIAAVNDNFELLDKIISKQFYELAFWQDADKRINYRRFFYLSDFIGLNVEKKAVLDLTHNLIFKLAKKGLFTGLRIDHIDGLYDPADYLRKVRKNAGDIYIIVEKILSLNEKLPHWPIEGTTGYDFLNFLNGIFLKAENLSPFTEIYQEISGSFIFYNELLTNTKKSIIEKYLSADIDYLLYLLSNIIPTSGYAGLKKILTEIMANMPVYRTYIKNKNYDENDLPYIKRALELAGRNLSDYKKEYNALKNIFLSSKEKKHINFIMRFQQLTAPVTAKAFEDTFLYDYFRFISLNEVGGNPAVFGISLDDFHKFNALRKQDWPYALSATSTHDTKRGEDVRARLNVLSEIPELWRTKIKDWFEMNSSKKKKMSDKDVPDKNIEYFIYQTFAGAFPFYKEQIPEFKQRIKKYITKVLREGKIYTNWANPNVEFEEKCLRFVDEMLNTSGKNKFLNDFLSFQKIISHYGIFNSLSQLTIKAASPGIPDFYQGAELWDLNLVDPDNRRPVDFNKRKQLLKEIRKKSATNIAAYINEILSAKEDGRIKFFLLLKLLNLRKEFSLLFNKGAYAPLRTEGKGSESVIAFSRNYKNKVLIVIAPRFLTSSTKPFEFPLGPKVWQDTAVVLEPDFPTTWKNHITEKDLYGKDKIYIAEILDNFPVGLLLANL